MTLNSLVHKEQCYENWLQKHWKKVQKDNSIYSVYKIPNEVSGSTSLTNCLQAWRNIPNCYWRKYQAEEHLTKTERIKWLFVAIISNELRLNYFRCSWTHVLKNFCESSNFLKQPLSQLHLSWRFLDGVYQFKHKTSKILSTVNKGSEVKRD